jgi:hypothetical protein
MSDTFQKLLLETLNKVTARENKLDTSPRVDLSDDEFKVLINDISAFLKQRLEGKSVQFLFSCRAPCAATETSNANFMTNAPLGSCIHLAQSAIENLVEGDK